MIGGVAFKETNNYPTITQTITLPGLHAKMVGDDEGDVDNDEDKESVSARVCMDVSVCVWFCMCVYIPTSLVNIKLKKIRF